MLFFSENSVLNHLMMIVGYNECLMFVHCSNKAQAEFVIFLLQLKTH